MSQTSFFQSSKKQKYLRLGRMKPAENFTVCFPKLHYLMSTLTKRKLHSCYHKIYFQAQVRGDIFHSSP